MKKNRFRLANVMMLGLLLLGTVVPSVSALAETIESSTANSSTQVTSQKDLEPLTDSAEASTRLESTDKPTIDTTSVEKEANQEADSVAPKAVGKETKTLTILGTSDVHGNVWDWSYEDDAAADLGFAKIGTIVKAERAKNPHSILVDAGDNLQGTLLTDDLYSSNPDYLTKEHPVITAMKTIGYDSMSLGNHEFNFGLELIKKVEKEAAPVFPLLSANTYVKETDKHFVQAYKVQEVDGVTVGILGLTIPHVAMWDGEKVNSLYFTDLNVEAAKQVKAMKEKENPDIIVAAIHAGLDNSDPGAAARNVILEVPEIDAFVLGHDHREYAEMIADNRGTLKPAAAVKDTGAGVVKIDLQLEKNPDDKDGKWSVAKSTPSIISSKDVATDESVRQATTEAHKATQEYVKDVIGNATADFLPENEIPGIPEAQLRPTAMISLINNVQMKVTGSDIAAGALFRADSDLKAGPVTFANIFNIYKYPNTLIGAKMNGKQLKAYMERQAGYYQQYEKGDLSIAFNPNIRVYNYDMVTGVKYKIDISKPEGQRIVDLTFNDKPVTDELELKISINNYRFEGMVKDKFVDPEPYYESDPDTLRGEIVKYIRDFREGTIDPKDELKESFEIIGADLRHPARDYVIEQIKAGAAGFTDLVKASADGRTPNVEKININNLIDKGLIPSEYLGEGFNIMHTNDIHGRLEYLEDKYSPSIGMARVKTFKETEKPTLLVDAGDAMQGLPISNLTKGADMVKAMNAVGYDAMTLGNHEFDFGIETALQYQKDLTFPIVSANVYKGDKLVFKPYTIVEKTVGDKQMKFALIGLTTPETSVKTHPNNIKGISFKKPAPIAIKTIEEIGDQADAYVFMTHLGFDETTLEDETSTYLAKELAKAYPNEKIFIADGHSHSQLPEGHKEGNVLIGQTGNYLNNVGVMSANYSKDVATTSAKLVPFAQLKSLTPDTAVQAIVDQARANFDEVMKEVVIENNTIRFNGTREIVRSIETNLGNLIGDALFEYGQTGFKQKSDFAVVNGGGIRQDIGTGIVTKGDIVGVMPFGNTISQVQVSGQEIYDMFEHSVRSTAKDAEGNVILDDNGLPMLGQNGGFLQVSDSIKITYDSNKIGADPEKNVPGERVTAIQLRNQKTGKFVDVDKAKKDYYLATNDFLVAGGDGYGMLVGKPVEEGDSLDEAFLPYLRNLDENGLAKYAKELTFDRIIPKKSENVSKDFSFSIMHTNDMHGRLDFEKDKSLGMAKLKTYKDTIKPTLMLDGGDSVQGLAISNFSEGMDMAKAMSLLPYDGVAAGNHEFDFGYERAMAFKQLLPMVSANAIKDGKTSFDAKKIVEKDGKKFAIIGLSTPETAFKTHPKNVEGVTFQEPIKVAKEQLDSLKGKADAFIFVTHLGIDKTTPEAWRGDTLAAELSKAYPDEAIVIIDGHSHSELREGQVYGNTLLAQTGNYLNNVGNIEVTVKSGKVSFNARLVPTKELNDVVDDPAVKEIVDATKAKFEKEMNEIVLEDNPVYFEGDGAYGRTRETNLGNVIGDALENYGQNAFSTPADFAVINGGGIRVPVEKGKVTKGDILAVLPFGNTIAQIDVTGQQIYEMFEHSLRSEAQKDKDGKVILDDKGLPMLGRNGGYLQVSNSVKIIYDSNLQGAVPENNVAGRRVLDVQILNRTSKKFESVMREKTYKVATNDFLAAGGDGYTMLGGKREEGKSMDLIFTEFLQEITRSKQEKVVPLVASKYQLTDYTEPFPYSRIIPMTQADFEAQKPEPELDLALLEAAIIAGETLKGTDYTKETWENFAKALEEAKSVLKAGQQVPPTTTQEKVNQATEALTSTREALKVKEPVKSLDLLGLEAVIKTASVPKEADFTAKSWKNLMMALKTAKKVLAEAQKSEPQVTQTEVNSATWELQIAIGKLDPKGKLLEVKALALAIEKAMGLKEANYTPATWNPFLTALEKAQSILAQANSQNFPTTRVATELDQEDVDLALADLKTATNRLKLLTDAGTGNNTGTSSGNASGTIGSGSSTAKKKYLPQAGEAAVSGALQGIIIILGVGYLYKEKRRREGNLS
ncbi:5'-nucleotidase C-terminal domain-containing protein [uncultured Vagococcus sp.]|uniref:5'-nucleotidase C-terminal domain-containing protein n=1 Tax=uncultured Vagococcus sp. TaxID=189676 RepID=UPI0028D863D9|nr:5'-nucleotidase C-terminal domain-containing protein [uncultured Vagococcus sp.]